MFDVGIWVHNLLSGLSCVIIIGLGWTRVSFLRSSQVRVSVCSQNIEVVQDRLVKQNKSCNYYIDSYIFCFKNCLSVAMIHRWQQTVVHTARHSYSIPSVSGLLAKSITYLPFPINNSNEM